jgi:sugar phosphate isomerase/epimerase
MIYVSTACINNKRIADIIQLLAKHNITNIEMSGGTDYYDGIEDDLKKFKDIHKLNYACHAYFPPPKVPFVVNLASCNDDIYQKSIDHYKNCIEMLKRLNCKVLSIHAGFLVEVGTDEIGKKLNSMIIYDEGKAYDRFCTAYEYIKKLCVKNGIEFYLENNVLSEENYKAFGYHNYMMMTDYDSIMKMKNQLDFNLLLDLGHLHVSAHALNLNYAEECKRLKDFVRWIHISNNNGIFDEHKPLKDKSAIIEEFHKIYKSTINVTLETVGNIEDILTSIEILKKQMHY